MFSFRRVRRDARLAPACALFTVLTLFGASCGFFTDDSTADGADQPTPSSLPLGDGTPTTNAPGHNRFGGVVQLGMASVGELDPLTADLYSVEDRILVDLLFDGLTAVDGDGAVVQAVAESWETDAQGLTWQFDLADTTFANGRVIEAADVKWSLERLVLEAPAGRSARNLDIIVGVDDVVAGDETEISGIEVDGPGRITFRLDQPFAALPALLAAPDYGIVPPELVNAGSSAFADAPMASGPFSVVDRTGEKLVLERTDRFNGDISGIEVVLYEDIDAAYDAFTGGALDWALTPHDRSAEVDRSVGSEVITAGNATVFFGMNSAQPDLANLNFRRAVVRAIDAAGIVDEILPAIGSVGHGLLARGVPGAIDDACGDSCTVDSTKAAAIVAFLFPDGDVPTLSIDYLADDAVEAQLAEAIADNLAAAGIPTDLRPATLEQLQDRILAGEHELFRYGWVGAYPSPDAWLDQPYTLLGAENVTSLIEPEIDRLLADARAASSVDDAAAIYLEIEQAVLDAAVVIPLASLEHRSAVGVRLSGLSQRGDGTLDFAAASLS